MQPANHIAYAVAMVWICNIDHYYLFSLGMRKKFKENRGRVYNTDF